MTIDYRAPPIEQQTTLLARTLPDGRVWNAKYDEGRVLGRLVRAFAAEINRVFARIADFVLVELDPAQTRELLLEWEESVGIPDPCFGRSADLAERRRRVRQKLSNFGGIITRDDMVELLADFGEAVQIVPGNEVNAELLGFPPSPYTDDQLKQIKHTVAVRVSSDAEVFPLDFPIEFATDASSIVQCLMRRITPANVALQFFFNEDLAEPFGGGVGIAANHTGRLSTMDAIVVVQDGSINIAAEHAPPLSTMTSALDPEVDADAEHTGALSTMDAALTAFSPPDIANLELWLDAQVSGSITDTAGEVSAWADLSSAGNDLTQGTAIRQPNVSSVNSNASVQFDGDATDANADLLRNAVASITSPPATMAVVFTPTDVSAGTFDLLKLREGFTDVFRIRRDGTRLESTEGNAGATTEIGIDAVLAAGETRWVIVRWRNSGDGTSDMLTDEGGSASATAAAAISALIDDINLGANANGANAHAAHVHEVLYYGRFITDGERTLLGDYLTGRWNLS